MRIPAKGNERGRRAAFTLIEIVMAASFLALMVLAVTQVSERVSRSYDSTSARDELSRQATRALESITEDLRWAGRDGLTPAVGAPLGTDTLDFQHSEGYAGGAVLWGPVQRLAFAYAEGELDDGLDNDGNGLIDDGVLVWTEDPGGNDERSVRRVRGVRELLEGEVANGIDDNGNGLVDEAGISFEVQGDLVLIRLSLECLDSEGRLHTKTVQSSIELRN